MNGRVYANRWGFTLVELLVVIAIIAVLAAILFPIYVSAKESARQASCLAHGRQIGMALTMYSDDQGYYPASGWYTDSPVGKWVISLMPYAKNQGVFTCPSFTKSPYYPPYLDPARQGYGMTYVTQVDDTASPDDPLSGIWWQCLGPVRASQVVRSSRTVLITDSFYNIWCADLHDMHTPDGTAIDPARISRPKRYGYYGPYLLTPEANGASARHKGGANYVYFDGHSKWLAPRMLVRWYPFASKYD